MIKVILALILLVNGLFAYRLIVDLIRHKSEVWKEPGSNLLFAFLGLVSQFLGTFGVSDFAFNTAAFRLTKTVQDKKIPGTLNAAAETPISMLTVNDQKILYGVIRILVAINNEAGNLKLIQLLQQRLKRRSDGCSPSSTTETMMSNRRLIACWER